MLLSNPEVADVLNREVVPCWETVRPAPQVTINFGNGRVLRRTLQGNTVILLCLPDGRVVDAFPGVYVPRDFLAELKGTLDFLRGDGRHLSPERLRAWHEGQVTEAIRHEQMRTTLSKAFVESPLLAALGISARPAPPGPAAQARPPVALADPGAALAAVSARIEDVSKQPASVEQLRVRYARTAQGRQPTAEELGAMVVEIDSRLNVTLVRPAVHLLFASWDAPPPVPQARDAVYKQVLHVPVDDPYLGLAAALVPGTPAGH